MPKQSTEDKIHLLFEPLEEKQRYLIPSEIDQMKRYQTIFIHWLETPETTDKEMFELLKNMFDISRAQAYRDMFMVKSWLGNVQTASKKWAEYTLIEWVKETYTIAKASKNPIAMAAVIDKLGKYMKLDKDDDDGPNWEDREDLNFEITSDPTEFGGKKIANLEERKQKLRQKYSLEVSEAKTVDDEILS